MVSSLIPFSKDVAHRRGELGSRVDREQCQPCPGLAFAGDIRQNVAAKRLEMLLESLEGLDIVGLHREYRYLNSHGSTES